MLNSFASELQKAFKEYLRLSLCLANVIKIFQIFISYLITAQTTFLVMHTKLILVERNEKKYMEVCRFMYKTYLSIIISSDTARFIFEIYQ